MAKRSSKRRKVAFQGEPGANSDLACREAYPAYEPLPCPTFEDAFAAVRSGRATLAMIPIDNSVAGRVADIHHLMPRSGLHIVAEWFLPVQHQLMAPKGATLKTIRTAESHVHALGQCRNIIREARDQGRRRRRYRGRGARGGRGRRRDPRGAGDGAGGENLRPANPQEGRRGREAQHHALHRARPQAEMGEPQRTARDHHVRVRGAQHPGRALQGAGRLRHQRRQHDQARKLHGRAAASPPPSSTPTCRAIPKERGLELALEELEFVSRPKSLRILGVYPAHRFRETFK